MAIDEIKETGSSSAEEKLEVPSAYSCFPMTSPYMPTSLSAFIMGI